MQSMQMMKYAIFIHFILGIIQLSQGKDILSDEGSHELHLDYKSSYEDFDRQSSYFQPHITIYYVSALLIAFCYLVDQYVYSYWDNLISCLVSFFSTKSEQ